MGGTVALAVLLICLAPCLGQEKCNSNIDLGFIIDSSGSLRADYQKEKNFVKALAGSFEIGPNATRAGVVTFSYHAKHSIKLNETRELGYFMRDVDDIPLMGSDTRTDKALRLAQRLMFAEPYGGREDVPNVLILMTDGAQTRYRGAEKPGDIANQMRKLGITVIVVGIGDRTDEKELRAIAGKDGKVFHVEKFDDLMTLDMVDGVTLAACIKALPDEAEPVTNKCADGNGGCHHTCINYYGSYECKCREGFELMSDRHRCQDVDECRNGNGGCNMQCENSQGSFKCICREGFKLGADQRNCEDVNECDNANGGCNQICINKMGSHVCGCMAGFRFRKNDERICEAIKVHGQWGNWGKFSACSKSCIGGYQVRTRKCDSPKPNKYGRKCRGMSEQRVECNREECPEKQLPVDGNWGQWTRFTDCDVSCGGGNQTRTRYCNSPPPMYGGTQCYGTGKETRTCNDIACPVPAVDGNWGPWTDFDECSRTCGGGNQFRIRHCDSPAPSYGGRECDGRMEEERRCNEAKCIAPPVDGNWGDWGLFSPCSTSCGEGKQYRVRSCNSPAPANGGRECAGSDEDSKTCNLEKCPGVDGNWGDWGRFSRCSRSCGGGTQIRVRSCNNPAPSNGGSECTGDDEEERKCNDIKCPDPPVDGNWGDWGPFSACSRTCGGGTQDRVRYCNSPAPSNGGRECDGDDQEERKCNDKKCPDPSVDGNWGNWGRFSTCSRTCGGGTHYRVRSCNSPAPSGRGRRCSGDDKETKPCNTARCKAPRVDGNWGDWGPFTPCTRSCGGGRQHRLRACNSPAPSNGGRRCSGDDKETRACNTARCPAPRVDGNWGDWGRFSTCSRTCGGGTQYRVRSCNSPAPSNGGRRCSGDDEETRACNTARCPAPVRRVDGNWGAWGPYSPCSHTCGGGTQYRTHLCNSPAPSNGGRECSGSGQEIRTCNTDRCPARPNPNPSRRVDGNWGDWGPYSPCSRTCDGGTQYRIHLCNNPAPSNGGRPCSGSGQETRTCNNARCPARPTPTPSRRVDGNWGEWGPYSPCSHTCGGGTQYRTHLCNNPAPSNGGRPCSGSRQEIRACNTDRCPVTPPVRPTPTRSRRIDGNWGDWGPFSTCTRSCGGGTQYRVRSCNNPAPSNGGRKCSGDDKETQICDNARCPGTRDRRPPTVPTTQSGGECVDKMRNCGIYIQYCRRYRTRLIGYCDKTCGYCKAKRTRPTVPAPKPSDQGSSVSSLRVCSREEALKCKGYERRRKSRCKAGGSNQWFNTNCDFMCGKCSVKPECERGDDAMCSRHRLLKHLACSRSWEIKIRCPNMCRRCIVGPKTLEQIIYKRNS